MHVIAQCCRPSLILTYSTILEQPKHTFDHHEIHGLTTIGAVTLNLKGG